MKSTKTVSCVCLLLLVLSMLSSVASADGDEGSTMGPTVTYEGYEVTINDAYAVTSAKRVLNNPSDSPLNHTFAFRIPEGALISNFSIRVEGVTYYADVMEKEAAEEAFEEAVASGNSAGIVRQVDEEWFSYGVSFAPMETIEATLRYEQVLLKANGLHTYDLFLTDDPVRAERFQVGLSLHTSNPMLMLNRTHLGCTVDEAWDDECNVFIGWDARDYTPSRDLEVSWRTGGGSVEGTVYFTAHGDSGYFLHVYDPDPSLFGPQRVPKDFVFVLDESGSMSGTKFEQSKEALGLIYGNLRSSDRFSLVTFNTDASVYSSDLIVCDQGSKDAVLAHIRGLGASGGTDIHSGVVAALDVFKHSMQTVPIIVLLSDGKANDGLYERSAFRQDVLAQNTVDASIYNIALGSGAEWTFLEALALENDGRAIWVREDEDVTERISGFVRSFSSPLLKSLTFDYGPLATDVHPSQLKAHYEGSEVLVAGKFPVSMDELPLTMTAVGVNGSHETEAIFPVGPTPGADFVPRFWAFQKIKELKDRMKYNGTDNETVDQVTELALEFHFVTEQTSLFVKLPEELRERFGSNPEMLKTPGYSGGDHPPASYMCSGSMGSGSGQLASPPPMNSMHHTPEFTFSLDSDPSNDGGSAYEDCSLAVDMDGVTDPPLGGLEGSTVERAASDPVPTWAGGGLSSNVLHWVVLVAVSAALLCALGSTVYVRRRTG